MSQTILITGCSTGIGKATALYFHEKGWNVVATMRTPEKGADLAALDNVLVTRLDVTDPASITAAVDATLERFGQLDALVNNAGYGAFGPLEATPIESIRRQFDTNVIGLLETTKAVLPHMRSRKSGVIVNISSVAGKMTLPIGALYHGTKFAVEGISESMQYELEAIGVRVVLIEPGAIKTHFGDTSIDISNDESLTEYQPLVQSFTNAIGSLMENASEAVEVAEIIYESVTTETPKLRYPAAGGAEDFLANRASLDDAAYVTHMKEMFGLS